MVQSNLTNKNKYELRLEELYRERMKLYNELTKSIIKVDSKEPMRQELIDTYRRKTFLIDEEIRKQNKLFNNSLINAQSSY